MTTEFLNNTGSTVGTRVDWRVGRFYTDERALSEQHWLAENPTAQVVAGSLLDGIWPTTYAETAGFLDLTFHITDPLDVQLEGRESQYRQTYSELGGGDYGRVFLTPEVITRDNAFTYLATPRLRLSPQWMEYVRLASGYRPGGPNLACSAFQYPCHFDPDKTRNYELGVKGNVLDHVLSLDASLYYIQWNNMQLDLNAPGRALFGNGGSAKSLGLKSPSAIDPSRDFRSRPGPRGMRRCSIQGFRRAAQFMTSSAIVFRTVVASRAACRCSRTSRSPKIWSDSLPDC
jgi:outer membrane receptor protein involved in Fe transport